MYCYPCRSRELIRAECCWFMLFELLIKIILVVLCYSVNSYMIPLKYSVAEVAEAAEWRKFFRHLRQKRHFTHLHFLTSLFCRFLVQFVLYQQIELVSTTISPSFVLLSQGLLPASRRLAWWSPQEASRRIVFESKYDQFRIVSKDICWNKNMLH